MDITILGTLLLSVIFTHTQTCNHLYNRHSSLVFSLFHSPTLFKIQTPNIFFFKNSTPSSSRIHHHLLQEPNSYKTPITSIINPANMFNWDVKRNPVTKNLEFAALSDDDTIYRKFLATNPFFILVLTWLASFKLGNLKSSQRARFHKMLKNRPDTHVVVHGLWLPAWCNISDLYEVPRWVVKFVYHDLLEIFQNHRVLAVFIHNCWSNVLDWEPLDFDKVTFTKENWPRYCERYSILVYQFIKHAMRSGMSLLCYVDSCKRAYDQVNTVQCFSSHADLKYAGNTAPYSIYPQDGCPSVTVDVSSFASSFYRYSASQISPSFSLVSYVAKNPNPRISKIGRICPLSEMEFDFDVQLVQYQARVRCKCSHHGIVRLSHRGMLMNHPDRLDVLEDVLN